jgi:hypothetical protein
VEQQVGEGDAGQRDGQVAHGGEVTLTKPARLMDLRKDDILLRPVEGAPLGDVALEGAQLAGGVAVGMLFTEQGEEGLGLQGRVALELLLDPGSVVGERVGMRAVGTGLLERGGRFAGPQVFAGSGDAHIGAGGGLFKGLALRAFAEHELHLGIGLHGASF